MKIEDLARNAARLRGILGCRPMEKVGCLSFSEIVLLFEEDVRLRLVVDEDTDELVWGDVEVREEEGQPVPLFEEAHGLCLFWAWEMTNHQGYFDALQLEFKDGSLGREAIVQFKVAASGIWIFRVEEVGLGRSD